MNSEETMMILNELSAMNRRFDKMDERLSEIEARVKRLTDSVSNYRIVYEDEINKKIQRIAKGYSV
ncbi:MAG: hypothetical protein II154_01850 [Lachnospiraceae bacterium]|nr:hypothetical protein [Lachnospiraceae bacterium]